MLDDTLPPSIVAELRALRTRIETLEMSARATRTSIREGTFTVLDDAGNAVVEMGAVDDSYGFKVSTPSGEPVFRTLAEGGNLPKNRIPVYMAPFALTPDSSFLGQGQHAAWTDSSAFLDMWYGDLSAVGPNIEAAIYFWLPAGASMEWRLRVAEAGATVSTVASGSASAGGPGLALGTIPTSAMVDGGPDPRGRDFALALQARRTGGSGRVGLGITTTVSNY